MDMLTLVASLVYSAVPMILAITTREAAKGLIANKLGDDSAYKAGKVTLDPLVHLDIKGTILFPLFIFLLTQGNFLFGWAKPIEINESQLKNKKRDNIILALTGPITNFLMAICWLIVFYLLSLLDSQLSLIQGLIIVSKTGIFFNLSIMAFTLLPILPLDGGKIVKQILPQEHSIEYAKLEPYGVVIILLLAVLGVTGFFTTPIINGATTLLLQIF